MDAQELKNLNIAGIYHASTGQTLRERDVPEVTKFAEAVIKAAAERAVSPAESVQSVDTIQFQELLAEYAKHLTTTMWKVTRRRLIEHIDAKLTAAHAEGRRSALEELAKEKERADRVEAKLHDVHAKANAWSIRAEKAEADAAMWAKRYSDALEAAARQAPDLHGWNITCIDDDDGRTYLGIATPTGASAALSCVTKTSVTGYSIVAQVAHEFRNAFKASQQVLPAQPLQQEGGKVIKPDEDLDWLAKLDDQNAVFSQQAAQQLWEWYTAAHTSAQKWKAKAIALQPSDNLQQASTARAEPVMWLHTMIDPNGRTSTWATASSHDPMGKKGVDYSDKITV